jgi:hypothetical protein
MSPPSAGFFIAKKIRWSNNAGSSTKGKPVDLTKIFKANPYHDRHGRFSSVDRTPVEKHPSASPLLRAASQGFLYVPPHQGENLQGAIEWD